MRNFYSNSSPYANTLFNGSYLDIISFRNLPNEADDVQLELPSKYEFRPDLLAYDLYGDATLWWVFAVRNKDVVKDPVFDFSVGQKIYLPKITTLKAYLGI